MEALSKTINLKFSSEVEKVKKHTSTLYRLFSRLFYRSFAFSVDLNMAPIKFTNFCKIWISNWIKFDGFNREAIFLGSQDAKIKISNQLVIS